MTECEYRLMLVSMLLLKKHLVDLVRAGKKRQTIRYWNRPIVFPGQISFTPGLGKMKILRVEELAGYESLTANDARDDGFDTLEELLAELRRNYPEVPPGKRLYRVVFQWPVDANAAAMNKNVSAVPSPSTDARQPVDRPVPTTGRPRVKTPTGERAESAVPLTQEKLPPDHTMSLSQRTRLRDWIIAQNSTKCPVAPAN